MNLKIDFFAQEHQQAVVMNMISVYSVLSV